MAIAALVLLSPLSTPRAGDHIEAPLVRADPSADIADFYAWHHDGRLTAAITFEGYRVQGQPVVYDPDVLYGIHIDNDGDGRSDRDVWARFGANDRGEWGVKIEGLPGVEGALVGPVDETLASGEALAFAGLRDDPFFFDAQGLYETLTTGALSFDSERDFAAFKDAMVVVFEVPVSALADGPFQCWATTRRR